MNDTLAGASPVDQPVGRLANEGTDAEGPRGTYGCACLDRDSVQCAAIRYGMDHYGEACTCLCHQWSDDEAAAATLDEFGMRDTAATVRNLKEQP